MTVQIRLIGPADELEAVQDQLHEALGRPCVHIDKKREHVEGIERWYGEIDVPTTPDWIKKARR